MMPSLCRRMLAVAFTLLVSDAVSAQPLQWWKTEPARTELALTSEQSTEIEGIFQDAILLLRQQKDELDRLEGDDPRATIHLLPRSDLRLLHERPARDGIDRRGR